MSETRQQDSDDHSDKEHQAVALINQGKLQEAEAIYRELISAGSHDHVVYGNFAALCTMQGRFDEVIKLLYKALQLQPDYPEAHNNLGIALQEQGNLDAAISSYNTALQLRPDYPDAYYNLGNSLNKKGDLNAAIASYNAALKINPEHSRAHNNLGTTFKEKGNLDAAISSYNTALQLNPDHPDAHYNLGLALQEQGDLTAAIASYNTALQLKPDYPDAHYNLGIAFQEQGDLTAAIASYNTALQLKPNYPDAHYNLGIALQEQGYLDTAIVSFRKAIDLNPNFQEAYNNLGIVLQKQGSLKAAIASFNKAIDLKPDHPEAHWNSSVAMLLSGDYKSGWEKYKWRMKKENNPVEPHGIPRCDQLSSKVDLEEGKQLLLVTEQGLGDTLQFMRYINTLRLQGVETSLCTQPKLHTLIQASGIDISPLSPEQANKVTKGKWLPLLSLPKYLHVSPQNPITTEPYIRTTHELDIKWQTILSTERKPIIGINWQGNPQPEKTGFGGRSLALETFSPITNINQISLLSLQKGFGSEQLETCSFKDRFVSCQDQVNETWDFLETAAIIANCDLIITSDTAIAHLAGGMGKATWLLLQKVPDWRWGLEGESTFWYPTMRLFRQTERGNWDEAIERIKHALKAKYRS